MLETGTILQSRYEIIRPIGQGGMGTVYLAKDQRLGNTIALKESIFNDEKMLKAFEQEARLLAGLRHPALPKVSDHFSEGESTFLVMDFIAGNDLGEILDKRKNRLEPIGRAKPFEVDEVLNWAEQLLDALDYLHTRPQPIIHRDIKPQNLKLAERNQIILLDFGLAKGSAFQMTRAATSKSIFGYTPTYAPIEQIQGSGTDPRSDLYSLAATLYHLVTGIEPPDALTRANAFLGGEQDPLRPANELNPAVPAKVAQVITQSMSQHRNLRPDSARAMLKLLRDSKNITKVTGHKTVSEAPTLIANLPEEFKPTVPFTMPPQPLQSDPNPQSPVNPYPQPQTPSNPYPQPLSPSNPYPQSPSNPYPQPQTPSNPYPPNYYPANSYPPPVTGLNQGGTNPNPQPLMSNPAPSYANYSVVPPKKSSAKIWLSVIGLIMVLSGFVIAAVYFLNNEGGKKLPPSTNNNSPTILPPPNLANKNGANHLANADEEVLKIIKTLTSAEHFARIPAGEFRMGTDDHGDNNDVPHQVKITRGFEMSKYEITQAEWQAVMGDNPSNHKGDNLPVENVSWDEVQEFIEQLNALKDGYKYRLPTEAEWEYAGRAGGNGEYQSDLNAVAWTGDNSGLQELDSMEIWNSEKDNYRKRLLANGNETHPVGQKKPNKWGLFDMQGNVWEWCSDWYSADYYLDSPEENPQGPDSGTQKVNRGGSWYSQIDRCQLVNRSKDAPGSHIFNLGFRLVRTKAAAGKAA